LSIRSTETSSRTHNRSPGGKTSIKQAKAFLPEQINRVEKEEEETPASKNAIKEKIGKVRKSLEELVDLMDKQN